MNFLKLNDENFEYFCMKSYTNPQCKSVDEFREDMDRIKYLKRLFRKYKTSKVLRERLILNHLIILYNVFGIEGATRILFYKIEPELWPFLKTFIIFLKSLPEDIPECDLVKIPLDINIINKLRKI